MPRTRASTAALAALLAAALAACGGGSSPDCSDRAVRVNVKQLVGTYYLFADQVNLPAFDPVTTTLTAAEFLDAMVNSANGPDAGRGYSYLTTASASAQFFDEGTSLGFGIGLRFVGPEGQPVDQVFVTQVFGDGMDPAEPKYALRSPAARAGFQRGDEIVAVAPGTAPLPNPDNLQAGARQVATLLAADPVNRSAFFAALGSSVAGTVRDFRLKRALTGEIVDVQATAATYWLDPVPRYLHPVVLTSPGGKQVGYLMLRAFINPASAALATAVADLKAQGITDLIIDLRYDGGGLLNVASDLLDLLGGGRAGARQFSLEYNAQVATGFHPTYVFAPPATAITPTRVAFIMGRGSASASELLPFALAPHLGAEVALVGERSLGKPAGQNPFSEDGCPTLYVVLTFQLANRDARAAYWDGLPDAAWTGSSCQALDDLSHPTGDANEDSTRVALAWIDGGQGACTPIPPFQPVARQAAALTVPLAPQPEPSLAQRHIPDLY